MKDKVRIFSYLPNPRVWKSIIAANYGGIEIEVIGDKPKNLTNWLWDYDAKLLTDSEKENYDTNHHLGLKLSLAISSIFILFYFVYPSGLTEIVSKINIIQ